MQRTDLEKKISDYILTTYSAEYTGLLEVWENDSDFSLVLGIPSYMVPTVISLATDSEDDFLNYIYEELRTRNYMRLEIYKVIKTNEGKEE